MNRQAKPPTSRLQELGNEVQEARWLDNDGKHREERTDKKKALARELALGHAGFSTQDRTNGLLSTTIKIGAVRSSTADVRLPFLGGCTVAASAPRYNVTTHRSHSFPRKLRLLCKSPDRAKEER